MLRNKTQLDIALKDNFYHIPAYNMDGESFPIKYIAIYQSKKLFGKNAGIRYYGEIESVIPTKRKDIKEIPSNSEEFYYYVKIKEWKRLDKRIKPKEKGFIKETTTLFQLLNSTEVPELLLRSKEEAEVYFKIKSAIEKKENHDDIIIGNCTLKFLKSRIAVYKNDEVFFTETYESIENSPLNFLGKLLYR